MNPRNWRKREPHEQLIGPIAFSTGSIPPCWRKEPCSRDTAWEIANVWCAEHGLGDVLAVRTWDRKRDPYPEAHHVSSSCWIAYLASPAPRSVFVSRLMWYAGRTYGRGQPWRPYLLIAQNGGKILCEPNAPVGDGGSLGDPTDVDGG